MMGSVIAIHHALIQQLHDEIYDRAGEGAAPIHRALTDHPTMPFREAVAAAAQDAP